jgi:hypothetical protein
MTTLAIGIWAVAFLGGYMNTLLICESNEADIPWRKKLSLIGRVLACPVPSVVPGKGVILNMLFLPCLEAHRGDFLLLGVE